MVLDNTEIFISDKEKDFLDIIDGYVKSGSWCRVPSSFLEAIPVENIDITSMDLASVEAYSDTAENLGLYLCVNEKYLPCGNSARKSLLQRARISGSALTELSHNEFSEVINTCIQYSPGDALIRFANDKIRAVLGGDESEYSILDMSEIFKKTSKYLNDTFKQVNFYEGSFTHDISVARWFIKDDKLLSAYQDFLKILPVDVSTFIIVSDSDTGFCGANILYGFSYAGHKVYMPQLKCEHKNKKTIIDFEENLNSIFPLLKENLEKLSEMDKFLINYPLDCIANLMSKVAISKKTITNVVERHRMILGEEECSAKDVYLSICAAADDIRVPGGKTTSYGILDIEERISRILSFDFRDYDYKNYN